MTGKAISRRELLRGAGAALSLPLLDAMLPAAQAVAKSAADASKLKRLGYGSMPMGYNPAAWTPTVRCLLQAGADFDARQRRGTTPLM